MAEMSMTLPMLDDAMTRLGGDVDLSGAIKGVRQLLISDTLSNFEAQATPDGEPWAPLKKPRRRKRDLVRGKKRGRPKKGRDVILQDSGLLRTSVTASGASGNVDVETPHSLEWGTVIAYGDYHQSGTMDYHGLGYQPGHTEGLKGIPARPFLGINTALEEKITDLVGGFVERTIAARLGA